MFIKVTSIVAIIISREQMKVGQKCTFRKTNGLAFKKGKPERDFAFWNFVESGWDMCPVEKTEVIRCG